MKTPSPPSHLKPTRAIRPLGFSLLEILVTTSIIVILVSIAFPVISQARAKSEQTFCASRLKALGTSFFAYAADNDGVLPIIDYVSAGGELQRNTFWATAILPYIGASDLNAKDLKCPTIATKRGNAATSSPWSYSMNNSMADIRQPASGGGTAKVGKRSAAISAPSRTVMLFCSPRAWTSVSRGNDIASGGPGKGYGNLVSPQTGSSFFGEVHGSRANVLFADGHVDLHKFLDINSTDYWGN